MSVILLVVAIVLFVIAAFAGAANLNVGRINLVALGLAFFAAAHLAPTA